MQISSINTNLAAYSAQANIRTAQSDNSASVSRLSSGNRITQASDDVAGLAIGTSLATNVSTLRTALTNASQAVSLLSVADSSLGQITEILQRQKSIAVQAGSGTLGATERAFLDAEFQALTSEIDRIATNTNFNGVTLIDGGLDAASLFSNTATQATAGALTLSFSNDIADGETIEINGVTLTAESLASGVDGLEFLVGATAAETVENLAARLNLIASDNSVTGVTAANRLAISEAKYEAVGANLVITSRAGGSLSSNFTVGLSADDVSATTNGEATSSGQFAGTSFNLFTDASSTSLTTLTQVLNAGGAGDATPFDDDEALTLTIGGVTHTLYTFTALAGSGTGGDHTIVDLVNGINANAGNTGVNADLVYNGTSYNVRLSYESQNGVAIIDGGNTYDSTTFKLTGDNIDLSGSHIASTGDDLTKSIVATDGYRNLSDADLNVALVSQSADAVHASATTTALPYEIGQSITATLNGETVLLHTFAASDGLNDIVASINAKTAATGVYAVVDDADGNALNVRLYVSDPSGAARNANGATAGINLSVGGNAHVSAAATANTAIANGSTAVTRVSDSGLVGGADDGLGIGSAKFTASSAVGDSIITDLSTIKANSQIIFSANATAGDTITFGDKVFYFTTNTSSDKAANEILIGDSTADTLDNAVATLNAYGANSAIGSEAYEFNQVNIVRDGNTLSFEGKHGDNVLQIDGTVVTIASSDTANTSVTNADLSNAATTFGVKVDGIANSDFYGTISGFTATYTGTTDQATLSVQVGDYTYTAEKVDLTIASNTTIRFLSDTASDGSNGGYFDIQLKANQINSVTSQAGANTVASRLDAAFSGLSFIQNREVSSYAAGGAFTVNGAVTGSLLGTSVTAQLADFDSLSLTDVSVNTATGSATDASVSLTIGGVAFTSANGIGTTLGANQTYRLTSATDADQFIEFTTGDKAISLTNADQAAAFETALKAAFGANSGSAGLSFQVGTDVTDTLSVSIGDAGTETLFEGVSLNVLTSEAAATAVAAIDTAISNVTAVRATVGALQSRFNFASANIQSSIQNQDAARGTLLDTDISDESTNYAISQVKLQAGISVLAQANQALQSLLKLIG